MIHKQQKKEKKVHSQERKNLIHNQEEFYCGEAQRIV